MAPVLEVDIDALNADGGRLESLGHPFTQSNCAPPGSDAVSLGAARALNAHEMALIELLESATRVREYGGAVIRSAAVVFELADRAGAASIHRVDNTNAPPITSSPGPLQMPALPPVPHQPPIASIPELPALPSIGGEQFSADLHSGPGSADLRDFSRAWHNYSQDITRTADDTRLVGVKVNEHWSSGDKAANNIMDHAKWLDSAAAWAERLSVAAEAVAHAFDIAKQDTPTPDEFSDAESDVMEAAALMAVSPAIGMVEYQQATSRYADLVAKAEEAAQQYDASVSSALTEVGNPIVPCPPIASQADIPVPPGPQLGPGVKLAPETPLIIERSQIEAKFKHAQDFGVTEPRGKAGFDAFEKAVSEQVKDPATMHIAGTYRGNPAILNYNPSTGTVVVQSPTGEFISGWRVSQAQATNILNQGKLGGG
jgi:hypothetical protein